MMACSANRLGAIFRLIEAGANIDFQIDSDYDRTALHKSLKTELEVAKKNAEESRKKQEEQTKKIADLLAQLQWSQAIVEKSTKA